MSNRTPLPPALVRRARPDDLPLLAEMLAHLSDQTRYLRYCHPVPGSPGWAWGEAARMLLQPPPGALTLIATRRGGPFAEAIGVAELVRDPAAAEAAELAVLVRDGQQGRGVGTALARQLVAMARARGISELHADLLPENRASLRLIRRLDLPHSATFQGELVHAVLRLGDGGGATGQPARPPGCERSGPCAVLR